MQCVSQCLHAPCASMLPVLHVLHASPLSYIARFVLAHYTFVLFLDSFNWRLDTAPAACCTGYDMSAATK